MEKLKRKERRAADSRPAPPRPPPRAAPSAPRFGGGSTAPIFGAASSVPVSAKLLGLACLALPLVAAVPYGLGLLLRTPVLREGVLRPLAPLIRAYHGSRYGSYAGIVGLYALARQRSVHPFVRTVGMQASTLMMMQFPVGFLMQFFAAAPRPLFNLLNTSVFAFYAWCVFLGALGCLSGRTVRMPLIGDGSLPSGGFYRGMRGGMRGGMGGMRPPFGGGGG